MPTGYEWWVSADEWSYSGPYQTKEQAISYAVLNGVYQELDGDKIGIHICEAQTPVVEDVIIDADALISDLTDAYEEYQNEDGQLFPRLVQEDVDDLQAALNQAFQIWARDHDLKLPNTCVNMRSEEFVTIPKPDHVKKLEEDK